LTFELDQGTLSVAV